MAMSRPPPQRRQSAPKVQVDEVQYQRKAGAGRTYTIRADRLGGFDVLLEGKVIKQSHVGDRFGASCFGSKKMQAEAFDAAKAAIEGMLSDEG